MWDLTVSDVHTFAVGEGQWVVHNAGPCQLGDLPMPHAHYGSQQEALGAM